VGVVPNEITWYHDRVSFEGMATHYWQVSIGVDEVGKLDSLMDYPVDLLFLYRFEGGYLHQQVLLRSNRPEKDDKEFVSLQRDLHREGARLLTGADIHVAFKAFVPGHMQPDMIWMHNSVTNPQLLERVTAQVGIKTDSVQGDIPVGTIGSTKTPVLFDLGNLGTGRSVSSMALIGAPGGGKTFLTTKAALTYTPVVGVWQGAADKGLFDTAHWVAEMRGQVLPLDPQNKFPDGLSVEEYQSYRKQAITLAHAVASSTLGLIEKRKSLVGVVPLTTLLSSAPTLNYFNYLLALDRALRDGFNRLGIQFASIWNDAGSLPRPINHPELGEVQINLAKEIQAYLLDCLILSRETGHRLFLNFHSLEEFDSWIPGMLPSLGMVGILSNNGFGGMSWVKPTEPNLRELAKVPTEQLLSLADDPERVRDLVGAAGIVVNPRVGGELLAIIGMRDCAYAPPKR
jgi:hypothetical protein